MNREDKRKELHMARMREFVSAARTLLKEVPFEELSIRRIAGAANMHNSTIYLHFDNADRLLAIASVCEFEDYSLKLTEIGYDKDNAYDAFFKIWRFSCLNTFKKPAIFYNFFYGKYSDNLTDIMNSYYELFPEEKQKYASDIVESMYFGNNLSERCLTILRPLACDPNTRVTSENLDLINEVIVYTFRGYIYKMKNNPAIPVEKMTADFISVLHYLTDK